MQSRPDSKHLALVAEAAPIAIVVVDAHGVIRLINSQAQQLFGYESAELVGELLERLIPERFREHHPALRSAYVDAASPRPMGAGRDLFGLLKDGREIPIEIGLNPFPTPEGLFILASIIDISERKEAEEHLRQIIDAAPNAKVLVDVGGLITLVNAEAVRLFGYSRDELLGQPVDMLLPERFRGGHSGLRSDYLRAPTTRAMGAGRDLYGLRKDGTEVPIEIGLGAINTPKGQFVLASIIDITERRRAEAMRIANAGVLQHAAELEALNNELESFSYSVSHDLRSPVRAIHGYARILQESHAATLNDEGRELLNIVQSAAVRMGILIDDILELSRLGREEMRMASLDMNALVRGILRNQMDDRQDSNIVFQIDPLPSAYGSRVQLERVWDNLISNSIKYSRGSDPPKIYVWGETGGDQTTYHIRDNGVGFDMKYAHKLFGVFQRLHRSTEFEGTGIGLAIAYRMIAKHHGRIWADSVVGQGTTFSFSLPLASSYE